ncbi:LysR substrate-binding domain-containing protein [Heliorestis convoluta]|uniref:LysR family transcriptional regulator n=1 Tax=Heliorestis convoluta TaxID=356322 RepID=A0A5Q2N706_9FIRM|nr:LysR substrate-binding domain-containing protein [Heliorestis convoluta]QGG48325.1 LysR family transcriptional regulator [Heliorestis convoluta]
MQFSSLEAIKQAVSANLGVTVLSSMVVEEDVIEGRLHIIQVPELMIARSINVIYLKDIALSVPAVAFLGLKNISV